MSCVLWTHWYHISDPSKVLQHQSGLSQMKRFGTATRLLRSDCQTESSGRKSFGQTGNTSCWSSWIRAFHRLPPTGQNQHVRLPGDSELSRGVSVCAWSFVSVWRTAACTNDSWDRPRPPHDSWIKRVQKMDGWRSLTKGQNQGSTPPLIVKHGDGSIILNWKSWPRERWMQSISEQSWVGTFYRVLSVSGWDKCFNFSPRTLPRKQQGGFRKTLYNSSCCITSKVWVFHACVIIRRRFQAGIALSDAFTKYSVRINISVFHL